MSITLTLTVTDPAEGRMIMPLGMRTPSLSPQRFTVEGAPFYLQAEATTGQWVAVMDKGANPARIVIDYVAGGPAYAEEMFTYRPNRYTRAADALATEARDVAQAAGGGAAGLQAIINHTCEQFTYGHPDTRFYEDANEMPQLCGMTEGSCVDINAYLIAALRAAGYEAGYVTGCFVPEEKRTWCEDMHCWVVTRCEGALKEWDIAHHLKMGTRKVGCALNPKPGVRVPLAHSMGLDLPQLGLTEMKLLSQPMWVDRRDRPEVEIRLEGYDDLAALEA